MAAVYLRTRDPNLDRMMDEAIAVVAKAQTPEGYIGTQTQLGRKKRWGSLSFHELYNMGHLITAACVHHRVTGKNNFLNIARKTADYLYAVFEPRPKELAHFCFNPSQIMGVVELYRITREPKYLALGGIFVDMRGSQPGGSDNNQTRVPLRQETEAVGHSVVGPKEAVMLNPLNGECCYRDARWSPDGKYFFFVFQRSGDTSIELYFMPVDGSENGLPLRAIDLPAGFFSTPREKPQPALNPAE